MARPLTPAYTVNRHSAILAPWHDAPSPVTLKISEKQPRRTPEVSKTGGRDFPPGVSGNPAGRPPMPAEYKALRRMTHAQVAEVGSMLMDANLSELQAMVQDPTTPMLKVAFASVVLQAIKKGDAMALDVILNRIVGKSKVEIELTNPGGGPRLMAQMTDEDVIREYEEAMANANAIPTTSHPVADG